MLQGVIFEIYGTFVDSDDAHAKPWVNAVAEAGYDVLFDAVRSLIGMLTHHGSSLIVRGGT